METLKLLQHFRRLHNYIIFLFFWHKLHQNLAAVFSRFKSTLKLENFQQTHIHTVTLKRLVIAFTMTKCGPHLHNGFPWS